MSHVISFEKIPPLSGRYDLYGAVHKGLRLAQCDLLMRLGATDFEQAAPRRKILADLRAVLGVAAAHVRHEDNEIHKALQAHSVSTDLIDEQHEEHRQAFAALEKLILGVENAFQGEKNTAGRHLYLAFAGYIAEDFAHMHEEETVTAPMLWKLFSDEELLAIEIRIVSSIPPEQNMVFMRYMIPAINPIERAKLLGGIKNGAPAEVFNAVMEFAARPNLSKDDFSDLSNRLGLAA